MKEILILISVLLAIVSIMYLVIAKDVVITHKPDLQIIEAMEYAYFNGQKDAVNGEIHIIAVPNTDSCYKWLSSPWDNNEPTVYTPDCNADKIYFR